MPDLWTEATDEQIAFEKAAREAKEKMAKKQEREGYTFHCDNCGLYLSGIIAYHSPEIDALTQFKYCPLCGKEV